MRPLVLTPTQPCRLGSALLLGLLLAAGPAAAAAPELGLPVDCAIGEVCFVQNYFDHDPGTGRRDHACGRLSYDGHTGTDIRTRDLVAMEEGVPVLAAAPGVVKATRDGMPDISLRVSGAAIEGREAGNGVVIDHGDGWETQYSHLRLGSVAVEPGQTVAAGDRLGLIGLSGRTEFPHVELSVRHRGQPVDPFVGRGVTAACDGPRAPLWSGAALAELTYDPTGVLIAGFATGRPDKVKARRGEYRDVRFGSEARALVFWVDLFGVQAGDRQVFRLLGPDGRPIHGTESMIEASNVSWFAFSGRRAPAGGWPAGTYTGEFRLFRDGATIASATRTLRPAAP